jgi:CRISPR/Cas system CSM-associated protein Csm3 (group 7 of RAMP superfamily)
MRLKYEIKFLDYWHLGSGLSAGTKLDSLVLKDSDGLPFASGKTLKGMFREMAEMIDCSFVNVCFGGSSDKKDCCYNEEMKNRDGVCYFGNAELKASTKEQILSNQLKDNLYTEIASTKIDERGVAVDNSLREIEVVIPITLYGEIDDVPADYEEWMKHSVVMVKRMGLNRNRGLGRCQITINEVL